jgi:hypothetical protein
MNSPVAQVTGLTRFSPRANANPNFLTDLAPDDALSMKLNLLRSNKF